MKPYWLARPASAISAPRTRRSCLPTRAYVNKGLYEEKSSSIPATSTTSHDRTPRRSTFCHGRTANAAYCDGHVETIEPFELSPDGDGLTGWMPNEVMDRE